MNLGLNEVNYLTYIKKVKKGFKNLSVGETYFIKELTDKDWLYLNKHFDNLILNEHIKITKNNMDNIIKDCDVVFNGTIPISVTVTPIEGIEKGRKVVQILDNYKINIFINIEDAEENINK